MAPRTLGIAIPILALAAAGLLAVSGPASAIYIVTPLSLSFSDDEVDVGDELTLDIGPNPEDQNASKYAGQTVRIRYAWNPQESNESDPDQPASSEDGAQEVAGDVGTLTLDGQVRGSLRWTIPQEADDHNVFFQVLGADDEVLANGHVRVGDAPPTMATLAGSGPAEGGEMEPVPEQRGEESAAEDADGNAVPGIGVAAIAVGAGVLALALRRR